MYVLWIMMNQHEPWVILVSECQWAIKWLLMVAQWLSSGHNCNQSTSTQEQLVHVWRYPPTWPAGRSRVWVCTSHWRQNKAMQQRQRNQGCRGSWQTCELPLGPTHCAGSYCQWAHPLHLAAAAFWVSLLLPLLPVSWLWQGVGFDAFSSWHTARPFPKSHLFWGLVST